MSLIDKVKKIKPFVYIIYGNTTNDQLTVSHSSTSPQTQCYKIGDIVDKDGVMGIVFEIDESCKHGKLISIKQTKCNWDEAKNWCNKLGSGWRLPNKDELRNIHIQKALINNILSQKEQGILGKYFWSIEEFGWLAQFVSIHSGRTDYSDKSIAYYVRAVYIF